MKELRVFGLAFQRADVWCKSVRCKNSVSFRSRTPQPNIRVRSYGSPVTMATGFNKSPNEWLTYVSNRGGTADFMWIRPWDRYLRDFIFVFK